MSKVLVDRELLESLAELGEDAIERMGSYLAEKHNEQRHVDAARAILAQPAEAEGVEAVAWLHRQGNHTEAADRPLTEDEEARGWEQDELLTVTQHLAALSAVTAERDGLAAARMAYANEFAPDENGDPDVGNVHANIRALKAERDRLLSDNASLRGSCKALGEENKQLKRENKRQGRTLAAMAAKEA